MQKRLKNAVFWLYFRAGYFGVTPRAHASLPVPDCMIKKAAPERSQADTWRRVDRLNIHPVILGTKSAGQFWGVFQKGKMNTFRSLVPLHGGQHGLFVV